MNKMVGRDTGGEMEKEAQEVKKTGYNRRQ